MSAGQVTWVILALIALIGLPRLSGIRDAVNRWRQAGDVDRIVAENEAIRLANDGEWAAFVRAHPLDDACPDCSLWDAEGDRPVPRFCDKHKEGAQ